MSNFKSKTDATTTTTTPPLKYDMNNKERGMALVINIRSFDNNKRDERVWSDEDVKNLTKTLNDLEFKVVLCENSTKEQIETVLKEQKNHKDSDCFLCVVMSHGNQDNILTSDNQRISFEEIMAPIKTCSSLVNKPKMFFFQVCRGKNEMESKKQPSLTSHSRTSSACSTKSSRGNIEHDYDIRTSHSVLPPNQTQKEKTKLEDETDLLVFNSTLSNHLSWTLSQKEGTIFIKSFCDVFNNAYKNLETPDHLSLSQMITLIKASVQQNQIQVAISNSTMHKELKFWPKDVNLNLCLFHIIFSPRSK